MAVVSHSFLVRVLFILSLIFNIFFVSRSYTGRTAVQNRAHRFHHRAVAVEKELDPGSNPIPERLTRPSNEQPPILDDFQEVAADTDSQDDVPSNLTTTDADPTPLVSHIAQYSQVARIKNDDDSWTVIEDLSQRDGDIIFESAKTKERKVFPKTGEAAFQEYDARYPEFAGLRLANIGLAAKDLLANRML